MWSPTVPGVASSTAPVDHKIAGVRTAAAHMLAAVVESAVHKVGGASPWNNSLKVAEEYTAAAAHTAAVLVAAVHKVVAGSSHLSSPHIQPDQFWNAALDTKTRHSRPGKQ
jgi:hypothetical protein